MSIIPRVSKKIKNMYMYIDMQIYWEFLPAKYECQCQIKRKTMYVYLQQDISLLVNKEITLQLPIKFNIKSGAVVLDTTDQRLVSIKQVFMTDSDKDGLSVTFYNRSYQTIDKKAGELLCILRHIG